MVCVASRVAVSKDCSNFITLLQLLLKVSEMAILLKKNFMVFLWMGFNCLKARATSGRQFTFIYKSSELESTFIDIINPKNKISSLAVYIDIQQ